MVFKIIYILNNFNKKQDKQTQNYVIDAKCNDCVAENIEKNIFAITNAEVTSVLIKIVINVNLK